MAYQEPVKLRIAAGFLGFFPPVQGNEIKRKGYIKERPTPLFQQLGRDGTMWRSQTVRRSNHSRFPPNFQSPFFFFLLLLPRGDGSFLNSDWAASAAALSVLGVYSSSLLLNLVFILRKCYCQDKKEKRQSSQPKFLFLDGHWLPDETGPPLRRGGIYCVVDFSFVAVVVTREREREII